MIDVREFIKRKIKDFNKKGFLIDIDDYEVIINEKGFIPPNNDIMITAIDLGGCLQIGTANSNGFFVVAQVDDTEVAFHIDSVVGIHKVEKEEIRDMVHFVPKDGYTDGAIRINKKLVILLNFENIVRDVNPEELTMQLEEDKIKEVFDE